MPSNVSGRFLCSFFDFIFQLLIFRKFINSDEVPFSILAVQNLINLLKNNRRHLNLFPKNMKFDQEQMTSLIIKVKLKL